MLKINAMNSQTIYIFLNESYKLFHHMMELVPTPPVRPHILPSLYFINNRFYWTFNSVL